MTYPECLVPKDYFPLRINLHRLVKACGSFVVARTLEYPVATYVTELADGRMFLDPDCLGQCIVEMSLNLMGGHLKEHHLRYRPKKSGTDIWGGGIVDLGKYGECFADSGQAFPLYFDSRSIHNQLFPVQLDFGPKEKGAFTAWKDKMQVNAINSFNKNGLKVTSRYMTTLVHSPNMLNYWHMHLMVEAIHEGEKVELKNDGSWRSKIFRHLVCEVLCKRFEIVKDIPPIPRCCYCSLVDKCRNIRLGTGSV